MTCFEALPNEIIRDILHHVQPGDLENFAQSSQHISSIAQPFLKDHRKLIRQYTTLSSLGPLSRLRDGYTEGPIPAFLRAVLLNPTIGHYIRKIDVGHLVCSDEYQDLPSDSDDEHSGPSNLETQQSDLMRKAATDSDFVDVAGWTDELSFGRGEEYLHNEEFQLALLMPLLPNLTTLSMEWNPNEFSWFRKMIEHVPLPKAPVLSNLSSIGLVASSPRSPLVPLHQLILLHGLPSLKSISAYNTWANDNWNDIPIRTQNSHATHLRIKANFAGPKALHDYLGYFDALQDFAVENCWHFQEAQELDPFFVRSGLQMQSRLTLKSLSIHSDQSKGSLMGSLQGFEGLQVVTTDWDFLVPDVLFPENLDQWASRILPCSLCKLELRDKHRRSDSNRIEFYQQLILSIVSAKKTTHPFIGFLLIGDIGGNAGSSYAATRHLTQICRKAGIDLILLEYSSWRYSDRMQARLLGSFGDDREV